MVAVTAMKVFGAVAALLMAAAAWTAATLAPRWPRGEVIRVWVDPARAPAGSDELVQRALKTWTDAAAGRFRLETIAARDDAPMRIHFFAADYRYGVTEPRVDASTGRIVRAEVAVAADAGRDPLEQRIIIYLTALHEVGHALGLSHTSDFDSIMYLFRLPGDGDRYFGAYRNRLRSADDIGSSRATGLFDRDVLALRRLYDE